LLPVVRDVIEFAGTVRRFFLEVLVVTSCWTTVNLGEGGGTDHLVGCLFEGFDSRRPFFYGIFFCWVSVLILGEFLVEITVHQCMTLIREVVC
jgi:hypothetical protein